MPTLNNTPAHEDRDHAILSASGMDKTFNCLPSILPLKNPVKKEESVYAKQGTLAHEYYEMIMAGKKIPPMGPKEKAAEVYTEAKRAELMATAQGFVDQIRRVQKAVGTTNIAMSKVETQVKVSENIWGTLDYCMVYRRGDKIRLYVADLKAGSGKAVVAKENKQLMTYAIAAIGTLLKPKDIAKVDQVTLAIYQPNNNDEVESDLDQWVCSIEVLKEFADKLRVIEKKAVELLEFPEEGLKKYPEVAGDHCRWCNRKAVCKTFARYNSADGMIALEKAEPLELIVPGKKLEVVVRELSDEQLSNILTKADLIREFLKAVESYVHARALSPTPLIGWKLVEGRTQRKLIENEIKIIDVFEEKSIDPYNKKLKGIGELESELKITGMKAKEIKEFMSQITEQTDPSHKLVPESDPRASISSDISLLDDDL